MSAAAARISASILVSSPSSGCRKSTVMNRRPGMVLRDCGWLSITPMVERPLGRLPIRRHSTISSAAPTSASRRPSIGVDAGMALHAGPVDLVPALPLRAGDDADRLLLALEDRALLDMRLEEGADRPAADLLRSVVADLLQRLAEGHAVAVLDAERVVELEGATEHARRHHRRREAAAFLVGPDRHFDRRLGDVVRDRAARAAPRARPSRRRRRRTCRRSAGYRDDCRS